VSGVAGVLGEGRFLRTGVSGDLAGEIADCTGDVAVGEADGIGESLLLSATSVSSCRKPYEKEN
jgi:hypothetical protein